MNKRSSVNMSLPMSYEHKKFPFYLKNRKTKNLQIIN